MRIVEVRDKQRLLTALSRRRALHAYEIGDLDDFFWPHTRWFAMESGRDLDAIALLYTSTALPVLLSFGDTPAHEELLGAIASDLPARMYSHLTPGLARALAPRFSSSTPAPHLKMALVDRALVNTIDTAGVIALGADDIGEVSAFYEDSYPENWFEPRMLATERYYGVFEAGELACVAGVHVHSPKYRVAALGNVATRPSARGRGLAARAVARLCAELLREVDCIALNVAADNRAAIALYRKLGFATIAPYDEAMLLAIDTVSSD